MIDIVDAGSTAAGVVAEGRCIERENRLTNHENLIVNLHWSRSGVVDIAVVEEFPRCCYYYYLFSREVSSSAYSLGCNSVVVVVVVVVAVD